MPTAGGVFVSFAVATSGSVSTFNVSVEALSFTPAAAAAISAFGGVEGSDPLFGVRFPGPVAEESVQAWNCRVVNMATEEGLIVVARASAVNFSVSAGWQ